MMVVEKRLDDLRERTTNELETILCRVLDTVGTDSIGTSFRNDDNRREQIYLGRENGELEYLYRKDPQERDYNYIYSDSYGWADIIDLYAELPTFRSIISDNVSDEQKREQLVEEYDNIYDSFESSFLRIRRSVDLHDLKQLAYENKYETFKNLVESSDNDEDGRVIWMLFHSKNQNDEVVDNVINVDYLNETDHMMLLTTERYYDTETYRFGAVVGYDDTPERFFVHRLEKDSDLKDESVEWDSDLIRSKMGFDHHIYEINPEYFPYDDHVRLQGDLVTQRNDLDAHINNRVEDSVLREVMQKAVHSTDKNILKEISTKNEFSRRNISMSSRRGVEIKNTDTEYIKELQEEFDIMEDRVRDIQDELGYKRLSGKRRAEIVSDIIQEQVISYLSENNIIDLQSIKAEERSLIEREVVDDTDTVQTVIGNHLVVVENANTIRRTNIEDTSAESVISVPEETNIFVLHDEHNSISFTLDRGLYVFRFLNGFETEWWM